MQPVHIIAIRPNFEILFLGSFALFIKYITYNDTGVSDGLTKQTNISFIPPPPLFNLIWLAFFTNFETYVTVERLL